MLGGILPLTQSSIEMPSAIAPIGLSIGQNTETLSSLRTPETSSNFNKNDTTELAMIRRTRLALSTYTFQKSCFFETP